MTEMNKRSKISLRKIGENRVNFHLKKSFRGVCKSLHKAIFVPE